MRIAAIGLAMLIGGVAASAAQEAPSRFFADWRERPTGSDVGRTYPREAMRLGHSGFTVLCCQPRDDGRLDCALALEWPKNLGFGAAALEISRNYRLTQESLRQYHERGETAYRLETPWVMQAEGDVMRFTRERAKSIAATADLCANPPPGPTS